jgi:probable rRNA maturation factor
MIDIEITPPYDQSVSDQLFTEAATAALRHLQVPENAALSIRVSGREEIQRLNHQFLGMDKTTDVLSFPSGDEKADPPEEWYLGDILICYPVAEEQASSGGHSIENELQVLAVHGVLHLLGYDHADKDEKSIMWAAQRSILVSIGCLIDPP